MLLQPNRSTIYFRHATQAGDRALTEEDGYRATRDGDNVVLRSSSGRRLATFSGVMRVVGGKHVRLMGRADNGVRDGLYRDHIEIRTAAGSGLNAINAVDLEDYLLGVVPGESPASWPAAALEAQAVAARSYAVASNVNGKGFDQYADTRSQVYRGYLAETPSTNAAVSATSGEVVTYGGEVATTFFFSTSGGYTENVENVFTGGSPKPWLKGVKDPYDDSSPYHRWGPFSYSRATLAARLGGWVKGRLKSFKVLERGVSPRVVKAKVKGTRGSTVVTGRADPHATRPARYLVLRAAREDGAKHRRRGAHAARRAAARCAARHGRRRAARLGHAGAARREGLEEGRHLPRRQGRVPPPRRHGRHLPRESRLGSRAGTAGRTTAHRLTAGGDIRRTTA